MDQQTPLLNRDPAENGDRPPVQWLKWTRWFLVAVGGALISRAFLDENPVREGRELSSAEFTQKLEKNLILQEELTIVAERNGPADTLRGVFVWRKGDAVKDGVAFRTKLYTSANFGQGISELFDHSLVPVVEEPKNDLLTRAVDFMCRLTGPR